MKEEKLELLHLSYEDLSTIEAALQHLFYSADLFQADCKEEIEVLLSRVSLKLDALNRDGNETNKDLN